MASPADETRTRLIDAANVIFSELGFHAATTRMICERAQANRAAVNYHFGDKLGLYTEVLELNFGDQNPRTDGQQLLAMDPEAALGEFVARFFHGRMSMDGKQQRMRILAHEFAQPTPALAAVVEQIMRPQLRILCEIIARMTESPPESRGVRLAAQSIIAQVTQYVNARAIYHLLWTDFPEGTGSDDEMVAYITRFSICGLASIQGPSKAVKPIRSSKTAVRRRSS